MQRIINVLALSSFLVSAAIVGSGVYLYTNKDALIEKVKGQIMESVTDTLPGALTSGFGGALVPNPTDILPTPLEAPTGSPKMLPTLPFTPF